MFPNIDILKVVIIVLISFGCQNNSVIEYEEKDPNVESKQEQFIRKLFSKRLISNDSTETTKTVIQSICLKTRYKHNFQINSEYDSTKLNFYIVNSNSDTSLKNLCAFAGKNTIFLDRVFLNNYIQGLKTLHKLPNTDIYKFNTAFQQWVIGHEIAHAELGHLEGHFINDQPPKTQEEAKQFHGTELAADNKCLTYLSDADKIMLSNCLSIVFNSEYKRMYGNVINSNQYLNYEVDPYLTFPYKLDGSHPSMPIRTAIIIYLLKANPIETREAYGFLLQSQLHFIKELSGDP